ncbi:MAG TPA: DUF4012 domain-containing protein [Acidimicrobiales bacterium]|nr:DUF4012 domain-containing protein [Acidimicrobiales bacterium]
MTRRRRFFLEARRLVASGAAALGVLRHPVASWRRWTWWRRGAAVVAIVVVAWALLLVVDLYRIQSELNAGRQELTQLTVQKVNAGGGIAKVASRADGHLQRADDLAHSSFALAPLAALPVIRGQVHGLRDITRATADLGTTARQQARGLQAELDKGASADRRVELVDRLLQSVHVIDQQVRSVHVGAGGFLLPPLSGARSQLVHELHKVDTKMAQGKRALTGFRKFLAEDHRVLILAANNAEMRGGNGMPLSAGVAHIHNGQIEVGDFTPTSALWNPKGPIDNLPTDLLKTYGWYTGGFAIGQEWRETNVSPNFPESAPIYARMAARQGLGQVDGVMMVDALALRALIQGTGPVTLNGKRYDAGNIIQQTLNENYKTFGSRSSTDRNQRLDLQSQLAKTIFKEFNTRSVSATKLAAALLDVTPGRHIVAWSADPQIQAAWHQLGIDGAMEPDAMLVSAENISANKLDYYITPFIGLDVRRDDHGNWLVYTAVTIYNPPRTDTSPQIEGGTSDVKPRNHRIYLDLHLPNDAYSVAMLSPSDAGAVWQKDYLKGAKDPFPYNRLIQPGFTVIGLDPPNRVVGSRYTIPYGTTRTILVQFHLPAVDDHITVLPSGRLHGQIWGMGKQHWKDDHRFEIKW